MAEVSRRRLLAVLGSAAASLTVAKVATGSAGSSPALTRGRGQWTSFGSVSLLSSARLALAPAGAGGHRQHADPSVPVPSAVHGAWTDAVVVDVEVHNGSGRAVELSPGQFRVRVDDGGPTVSLYRADRAAGPLGARSTTTMRISYLVPQQRRPLTLEFADAVAMSTLGLGRLDVVGTRS